MYVKYDYENDYENGVGQGCPTFSDRGPLKGNIPWRGPHCKL